MGRSRHDEGVLHADSDRRERRTLMATIRATCETCGDVELTTDVTPGVCIESGGSYSFRCPVCLLTVGKDGRPGSVELLVTSGSEITAWPLPAQLSRRPGIEPFTWDDVLAFHELLEAGRRFGAARRAAAAPPPAPSEARTPASIEEETAAPSNKPSAGLGDHLSDIYS
jgi:hypothetical protein